MKARYQLYFLALSQPVTAQRFSIDAALHSSDKAYIQATGTASVSTKPDQAIIEVAAVTQASTASTAAAENARQTEAVVAQLRTAIGKDAKLKTTNFSIRPNYRSPKPGTAPEIAGYIAENTIEVKLDDVTQVAKVVDGATLADASRIQRLRFGLKNPDQPRNQALREASARARIAAEAIAAGLGVRVVRVLSAEEPPSEEGFAMYKKVPPPSSSSATQTPIEIDDIEIAATISIRVEVAP